MPRSILEAVKQGDWSFEPTGDEPVHLPATAAMPGTQEKLAILAERLRLGQPLWHPSDRRTFDDALEE